MGRGYGIKWLNENLQPLVRFLRTNVGRPWSKVYAEVAAHVRCTSAVQKHVLDHLRGYVEENPEMIDGVPHHPRAHRRGAHSALVSIGMRFRFYVCPRTQLLRLAPMTPRKKKYAPPPDPDRRVLTATRELRRLDGVWFDVELGPFEGGERPIVRKTQLGSRAIERLGLRRTVAGRAA